MKVRHSREAKRGPPEWESMDIGTDNYISFRRAYNIINKKLLKLLKENRLQMIIKAINNIIGFNDLIFTLLIFGTFLKLTEANKLTATF
jgi:hypothetical protein